MTDRLKKKIAIQKMRKKAENVKSTSLQCLRRSLNDAEARLRQSETKTVEAESLVADLQTRQTKSEKR